VPKPSLLSQSEASLVDIGILPGGFVRSDAQQDLAGTVIGSQMENE
jgi:hypothetical protein